MSEKLKPRPQLSPEAVQTYNQILLAPVAAALSKAVIIDDPLDETSKLPTIRQGFAMFGIFGPEGADSGVHHSSFDAYIRHLIAVQNQTGSRRFAPEPLTIDCAHLSEKKTAGQTPILDVDSLIGPHPHSIRDKSDDRPTNIFNWTSQVILIKNFDRISGSPPAKLLEDELAQLLTRHRVHIDRNILIPPSFVVLITSHYDFRNFRSFDLRRKLEDHRLQLSPHPDDSITLETLLEPLDPRGQQLLLALALAFTNGINAQKTAWMAEKLHEQDAAFPIMNIKEGEQHEFLSQVIGAGLAYYPDRNSPDYANSNAVLNPFFRQKINTACATLITPDELQLYACLDDAYRRHLTTHDHRTR